jgi:hypothetical protein
MGKKANVWKILGLLGTIGGGICMMLQGFAEENWTRKSTRQLTVRSLNAKSLRGSDASLSFDLIFGEDAKKSLCIME